MKIERLLAEDKRDIKLTSSIVTTFLDLSVYTLRGIMLTDLAIKETYQTAFDMLYKSADLTGQEAGRRNFVNLQVAASSSGSAGELKIEGPRATKTTDKIPGPPKVLPAPAAVPHQVKEAIPAVSHVSSAPELVGISAHGVKDTIKPVDSASTVSSTHITLPTHRNLHL